MTTKAKSEVIQIQPLNLKFLKVSIVGLEPLIMHKWSKKARDMMLDKQTKVGKAAKKPPKEPMKDYLDSIYWMDEEKTQPGFPCIGAKAAMINGCRFIDGIPMTIAKGTIQVGSTFERSELFPIYGEHHMREDLVRVSQTTDIRHRAQFNEWSGEFIIRYNAGVLAQEQVINLLHAAGLGAGLGEWRPERGGNFGQFSVSQVAELMEGKEAA